LATGLVVSVPLEAAEEDGLRYPSKIHKNSIAPLTPKSIAQVKPTNIHIIIYDRNNKKTKYFTINGVIAVNRSSRAGKSILTALLSVDDGININNRDTKPHHG
jgi:hypothetical protein